MANASSAVKVCCTCKTTKARTEFHRSRSTADGLHPRCKSCRKHDTATKPQDPMRRRDATLRRTYGITSADYDRLFAAQGGVCAICERPETMTRKGVRRSLCVDHCHVTGVVRGLLCASCNFALGRFLDSPKLMHRAAEYLLHD